MARGVARFPVRIPSSAARAVQDAEPAAEAVVAADGEDGDRQFVTALARGLQVLRAFRDAAETLGNREIAARTGLPKPTVSRLTHTLLTLGYLVHDDDERYGLGPAVLALSAAFLRQNSFPQLAKPHLQDLATAVQAHVALGLLDGVHSVYIQLWRGAGQTITLSREVGFHLPLARSVMGMAMLAGMEEGERGTMIERLRRDSPAEDRPRLDAAIARCLREVEEHGFCVGVGIWHRDINAVAAPVHSPGARGLFAVNVSGPAFLLTETVLRTDTGPKLLAAMARMRALGIVD